MFGLGIASSIASLFSPRPAPPPLQATINLNPHSMHEAASMGANGSFHFGHCHQPPSCRPQPPCVGILPQPVKKQGFLSKLFGGIAQAISNIFKPITDTIGSIFKPIASAMSGIGSLLSDLLNRFKMG